MNIIANRLKLAANAVEQVLSGLGFKLKELAGGELLQKKVDNGVFFISNAAGSGVPTSLEDGVTLTVYDNTKDNWFSEEYVDNLSIARFDTIDELSSAVTNFVAEGERMLNSTSADHEVAVTDESSIKRYFEGKGFEVMDTGGHGEAYVNKTPAGLIIIVTDAGGMDLPEKSDDGLAVSIYDDEVNLFSDEFVDAGCEDSFESVDELIDFYEGFTAGKL